MIRTSLTLLGLALVGATTLHAQDPRISAHFPPPAAAHFTLVIDSAAHEGLPTEPLILRALEGQAKGASVEQIDAAISRLHEALRVARHVLEPAASAADLTTGAAALQAGVVPARLAELHKLRGTQGIAAPLGAYLDLMARGSSADRAWNRIADLARQRASDADFVRLTPQDVDRDATSDARPVHRPDAALLRVTTGGGQSQLDQLPSSSLTSLGGSLDARLSHANLQLGGGGQDHLTLGVAGAMHAAVLATLAPAGWQVAAGPVFDAARDIQMPWATTIGGEVRASRAIGSLTLGGDLQGGFATVRSHQSKWVQPALSARLQAGPVRIDARWQSTQMQDTATTTFDLPFDSSTVRQLRRINDASMTLGWGWHGIGLSGQLGRRYGSSVLTSTWWNGSASLHLTPTVALWAEAGRAPSNVILSLRSARFATVGLRFDIAKSRGYDDVPVQYVATSVQRESPTTVRLAFLLPRNVQRAAIASDLTQWNPVALTRDESGRWIAHVNATPGTYRINLRTDDGRWQAPVGIATSDDGFGNRVGLLVVE